MKRLLIFADNFRLGDLADIPHTDIEIDFVEGGSRDLLLNRLPQADAYMATLRIPIDGEVLEQSSRLRLIGTNSTGTDHLDLVLLRERGIEVLSLKDDRELLDQITGTAELALALVLSCARHLRECFQASQSGRWKRHRLAGRQLSGKTLGLVGCGRLGCMMAEYGRALRMNVVACDPSARRVPEWVRLVSLDAVLHQSDFVSLHVHLDAQTRGMIGAPQFAVMKRGACLINTSRGGLVDESALIEAMERGQVAAAGLDVIDGEWLEDKQSHPLIAYSRKNPRLYITPHVGGACAEAGVITGRHMFSKVISKMRTV